MASYCRLQAAPQIDQLFEAIDQDNNEWLERILTGNPDGWEVKDKVRSLSQYCTIFMLLLYSMGQACFIVLLVKVVRNVYSI